MMGYTILFVGYGIMTAALIITGVVLSIDLHRGNKRVRALKEREHDRICTLLRGAHNALGRLERERDALSEELSEAWVHRCPACGHDLSMPWEGER